MVRFTHTHIDIIYMKMTKATCEYILNYKASRYHYVFIFFFNIFSTAGRSICHSGRCDGERVKEGRNLSLTHTHKKLCPDICDSTWEKGPLG